MSKNSFASKRWLAITGGVLAILSLVRATPASAQPSTVRITKNCSVSWQKNSVEALNGKNVTLNIDLALRGANRRTPASIKKVLGYLTDLKNYTFVADWPSNPDAPAFEGDNPVFRPTGLTTAQISEGAEAMDNRSYQIKLEGVLPPRSRGEVHLKLPTDSAITSDWVFERGAEAASDPMILFYSEGRDWKLTPYSGKASVGFDGNNPTLDFVGDGYFGGTFSGVRSLAVRAKIPLRKPKDVRNTPGAETDASEDVPDSVDLSYNQIRYRKGGSLLRTGVRLRTTGTLHGLEAVGYYSPLMGWYNGARGFYAAELELGYRKGDAEFKNLTTRAADTGNLVARLGSVVEWAPQLGGVNRHLGKGLRFFVRGRGWLDTYQNAEGDTSLRFRPFADSELFWNFTEESRVYLRGEYGYLPPDLSEKTSRASVGVGTAF